MSYGHGPSPSLSDPCLLQAPVPRGEISYASLSLGILDQEPTYSNASHFIRHGVGRGHEESTEYSIIRKP